MKSEITGDAPCPRCVENGHDKTGNHLILFSNGNKSCNRCGYKDIVSSKKAPAGLTLEEISEIKPGGAIPDRKINTSFTELYGLRMGHDATTGEINAYYSPVHETGTGRLIGYQKRLLPKQFSFIGDVRKKPLQFFGQKLARESGKFLIIVEGALDTIAAKQMLSIEKKTWTVVGAWSTSMKQQFQANIEWLNGFDTIVLAFDQDKPGEKAVDTVMTLIQPHKLRVASYSENDPCDMLKADKAREFVHSLSAAKKYMPSGIIQAGSVIDEYIRIRKIEGTPFPPEMAIINKKTKGYRAGELVVWTAGTGIGKSQFCDEVAAFLIKDVPDEITGVIKMEHNNAVGLASVLSTGIQTNLKLYGDDLNDDQIREEWAKFFGEDRAFLIDHGFSGIADESTFMGKLMGLIVGSGCTTIIIDHLHAVMNETGAENDDVDDLMYGLQKMAQLYQVKIHIVMHLRKTGQGGKSFETGEMPNLDDLKGSGALKQVPDTIIAIARNIKEEDDTLRRVAQLCVLKNRWIGDTGMCDKLIYDIDKAKYFPYIEDENQEDKPSWNMEI